MTAGSGPTPEVAEAWALIHEEREEECLRRARQLLARPGPARGESALEFAQVAIRVYRAAPAALAASLIGLLGDADPAIRLSALEILVAADSGAAAAADTLAELVDDDDPVIAGTARTASARIRAARSHTDPVYLAPEFDCLLGQHFRARMRSLSARGQSSSLEAAGTAVDEWFTHVNAPQATPRKSIRGMITELIYLAAAGRIRTDGLIVLECLASTESPYTAHAAYGLWLVHGPTAAERSSAILARHIADAYVGPISLGYLAAMGRDAAGALDQIEALLSRRRRICVHDPSWQYELRSDDLLCAAARSARATIRAAVQEQ